MTDRILSSNDIVTRLAHMTEFLMGASPDACRRLLLDAKTEIEEQRTELSVTQKLYAESCVKDYDIGAARLEIEGLKNKLRVMAALTDRRNAQELMDTPETEGSSTNSDLDMAWRTYMLNTSTSERTIWKAFQVAWHAARSLPRLSPETTVCRFCYGRNGEHQAGCAFVPPVTSVKAAAPTSLLDRKVTVCSECLCACCWQGEFMCDEAKMAGTVEKTVGELFEGNSRENPEYWFKDPNTGKVDYDAKTAAKRAWLQKNG